jgi:hypothetical protein
MSRIAHSTAKSDTPCGGDGNQLQSMRKGCLAWNLLAERDVSFWSAVPSFESSGPQSEYTMNIFYIIGVIVVVLFVAGFFGLHV